MWRVPVSPCSLPAGSSTWRPWLAGAATCPLCALGFSLSRLVLTRSRAPGASPPSHEHRAQQSRAFCSIVVVHFHCNRPPPSAPPCSSLPAPQAKQYATAFLLSLPYLKNKLINLPRAMKTLSSWPLDLCGRSSSWRLKEFRVFFEKLFDSGRGSGAKRQRWSCKCLSPPCTCLGQGAAGGWRREREAQQFPGGCGGAAGPPAPPPSRCMWPSFGADTSVMGAKVHLLPQGAAPGPSVEMLGWVSASQQPRNGWTDGQTDGLPLSCSQAAQKASEVGEAAQGA